MWKKQLNSLSPFSINILRRNRIPSPCIATRLPPLESLFSKTLFLNLPLLFLLLTNSFYKKIAFLQRFFLTVRKSNLFCSVSASTSPDGVNCWNCNAAPSTPGPFLFCQNCRSVQPVDRSVDFFQILGMVRRYDTKGEDLEGRYKDWQKKLHPDLVHIKSQKEREFAADNLPW